jgi:hypothetical protein
VASAGFSGDQGEHWTSISIGAPQRFDLIATWSDIVPEWRTPEGAQRFGLIAT